VISDEQLRAVYLIAVQEMRKRIPQEPQVTYWENKLFAALRKESRMKIYRSVWIGKRNIDLFIPSICSKGDGSHKGLAIEVDGNFHDKTSKMRLDHHKYDTLQSLGIATASIDNYDLRRTSVRNIIENLHTGPRLDSRGQKRLWKKIYLKTIVDNRKIISLEDFFNEEQMKLIQFCQNKVIG
jgi:very-short-patch-repair endonuclease